MDQATLEKALAGLPLGGLRYFDQVSSTNTEAALWAAAGAPDLALVVADEQTAGRGRGERRWFTPPNSALAFSLVLRPQPFQLDSPDTGRLTALGALAISEALQQGYHLIAQIKWPNDVLLDRRKIAGVLVEAIWQGDQLTSAILGMGVNVTPASLPPDAELVFPAACVEAALGMPVDRPALLRGILEQLLKWRQDLASPAFIERWQERLAFQGEWVRIVSPESGLSTPLQEGQVLGLDAEGCLLLRDCRGHVSNLRIGEVRLRPLDS